jgi:hypothetical protein
MSQKKARKGNLVSDIVKQDFLLMRTDIKPSDSSSSEVGYVCENCSGSPCDWTEYGSTIVSYFTSMQGERMFDDDGNPRSDDDGVSPLTNKELRYLSYTAYIALKYGYLGPENRVRAPCCVENAIRANYPDDSGYYVGFRESGEG